MAKRRGNPNWGNTKVLGLLPTPAKPTTFDELVSAMRLTPDEYLQSNKLRDWAGRHHNSKYIPESLLKAWGYYSIDI